MIQYFEQFSINENKKGVRIFQFADANGNFLQEPQEQYENICPDDVDIKQVARDVFKKYSKCTSVFISEIQYENDEIVQKLEIVRSNPNKINEI